ncbi:MAG: hypothetical protein IK104_07290 [Clostridia bacterium]|nr:hypothetical protein [Clostridia bacterium]
MKKILCCLLALTLAISLLTVAAAPAAADADPDPEIVTYIYGDLNVYDASSALFLTAGSRFYARQEIDGEPFDPPAFGEWVSVDPTPVTPGPALFGREERPYYLCTVDDEIPEGMGMSGGMLIEDEEQGFLSYKTCAFVTGPHKDILIESPSGKTYTEGGVVLLEPGEEVYLSFSLSGGNTIPSSAWSPDPEQILISGWYPEPLTDAGFTVPDPVTVNGNTYLAVSAKDLAPGTEATIPIWFIQLRSISLGFDKAPVVYRGTLTFRVAGEVTPPVDPPANEILLGDVDSDGKVTASDARLALRRSVDLETFEPGSDAFTAADVDFDGKITAADARLILRAAVGLEELKKPAEPGIKDPDPLDPGIQDPIDPGIPVPVDPDKPVDM